MYQSTMVLLKVENIAPLRCRRGRIEKSDPQFCPFPTQEEISKELRERGDNEIRRSIRIKNKNLILTLLKLLIVLPCGKCSKVEYFMNSP